MACCQFHPFLEFAETVAGSRDNEGDKVNPQQMLRDKVVVVTGAGRGIGRGIALQMAAQGARVVVNDVGAARDGDGHDATPAQEVVDEIVRLGGQAIASPHSVADWDSAQAIIAQATDAWGRIDCVVNNAGILRDRMFHNMTPEDFDSVMRVHLYGAFYMSRAAITPMRAQKSGSLIHMSSSTGLIGNVGQANYAAAKLGIVALSKSIALDCGRAGIRSNAVSPSGWTRMTSGMPLDTPEQKAMAEKMQAVMQPEKVAPLVTFLASDASDKVTGQIFSVRGNEIFLYSHTRPMRSLHRGEGWTPQSVASHMLPAFEPSFTPLHTIRDVFSWDPV